MDVAEYAVTIHTCVLPSGVHSVEKAVNKGEVANL